MFLIGYEITHTPEFMFLLHTERARKFFSRCFSAAPESIWYSPSLLRVKSRESRPLELLPAACIKALSTDLLLRRKYVRWRCALVHERLSEVPRPGWGGVHSLVIEKKIRPMALCAGL